jgi:dTDP-4-dehydrorhamnose 3,5-epimerase
MTANHKYKNTMINSFDDIQKAENQLAGVEFKQLRTYADDRGFFREIIRKTDSIFKGQEGNINLFTQWSHSKMTENTVKAWHYHHIQTDWWYIGAGVVWVSLFDLREESPTYQKKIEFKLGDSTDDQDALAAVVKIPTGVAHGCKCLTDYAHLFYITSEIYNPNDEGRIPFNSTTIPHNWGNESELIVAENDKKVFVPTAPRKG